MMHYPERRRPKNIESIVKDMDQDTRTTAEYILRLDQSTGMPMSRIGRLFVPELYEGLWEAPLIRKPLHLACIFADRWFQWCVITEMGALLVILGFHLLEFFQ